MLAVTSDQIVGTGQNSGGKYVLVLGRQRRRILKLWRCLKFEHSNRLEEPGQPILLLSKWEVTLAFHNDIVGSDQFDVRNTPNPANFTTLFPGCRNQNIRVEKKPEAVQTDMGHAGQRTWSMVSGLIPIASTSLRASR